MMLDDHLDNIRASAGRIKSLPPGASNLDPSHFDALIQRWTAAEALRFEVSERVVDQIDRLAADDQALDRVGKGLAYPSEASWWEWDQPEGGRIGVSLSADLIGMGCTICVYLRHPISRIPTLCGSMSADPTEDGSLIQSLVPWDDIKTPAENSNMDKMPAEARSHILQMMFILLRLVSTPKILIDQPIDVSRINKAREKRGAPYLVSYSRIDLNLDDPAFNGHRGTASRDGPQMHFRRGHLRLLQTGALIFVRPCWVGNPEKGIRVNSYRVMRDEDSE